MMHRGPLQRKVAPQRRKQGGLPKGVTLSVRVRSKLNSNESPMRSSGGRSYTYTRQLPSPRAVRDSPQSKPKRPAGQRQKPSPSHTPTPEQSPGHLSSFWSAWVPSGRNVSCPMGTPDVHRKGTGERVCVAVCVT